MWAEVLVNPQSSAHCDRIPPVHGPTPDGASRHLIAKNFDYPDEVKESFKIMSLATCVWLKLGHFSGLVASRERERDTHDLFGDALGSFWLAILGPSDVLLHPALRALGMG